MATVLTVSQFIESIRGLFRETFGPVTIQGEVTGYRERGDQLVYFELKDEHSRVLCFGLRHEVKTLLTDGMEIRVMGAPSLFKQSGGFHVRVIAIELVGEGALRKAFEQTKKRLEAEGLFAAERKRQLTRFPESIGIVTSRDAAAFTDVCRVIRNRWPHTRLALASVAVQGAGAARQIVRALGYFSHSASVDIVILTRGGGSLEDLQSFNDEAVARAIYASRVPIVVGVGHERDETIADYVADVRAATPSNAAERSVPDMAEVLGRVELMSARLQRSVSGMVHLYSENVRRSLLSLTSRFTERTSAVQAFIHRFPSVFRAFRQRMTAAESERQHAVSNLTDRMKNRLGRTRDAHDRLLSLLQTLSPLAILTRGYSITTDDRGRSIRTSASLSRGQTIKTRFGKGSASSHITEVK